MFYPRYWLSYDLVKKMLNGIIELLKRKKNRVNCMFYVSGEVVETPELGIGGKEKEERGEVEFP